MKKFFVVFLSLIFIISLFACEKNPSGDVSQSVSKDVSKADMPSKPPSEGSELTSSEASSEASGNVSDHVSDDISADISGDASGGVTSDASGDASGDSSTVSQNGSNAESSSVVSVFVPEEKYLFMTSKYYVTTKIQLHGITYRYVYYLVKGRVAGAVHTITLRDTQSAKDYYKSIQKKYPDAQRKGAAVTMYLEGSNLNYSGYSYEKLKFVLEKSEIRYMLSFDEEDYLERYGGIITD